MVSPEPGSAYTFLTGGARSGKSSLAVRLATASQRDVMFLATAEPLDDEMAERIALHQHERPDGWVTVEVPRMLVDAVHRCPADCFVIVDCLSLWVSNLFLDGGNDIESQAHDLRSALSLRGSPAVVVTNEVGLGIVPGNAMARGYRDVLGRVNAIIAAHAANAYLVVAGRTLALERPPV